jgi:hypothetical protein
VTNTEGDLLFEHEGLNREFSQRETSTRAVQRFLRII